MKVLISGAAGFLGSHLCAELAAKGHQVVAMDLLHQHEAWRLRGIPLAAYKWGACEDLQASDLTGIEGVIHCAASTDVPYTRGSPRAAVNTSILGTVALLEAAKQNATVNRLVIVSSYSAYGRVPHEADGIHENNELHPTTLYGAMKAAQELVGGGYYHSDNLPVTFARLATLYGPRSRATLPVALFIKKVLAGEPITLTGDGRQTRDQNWVGNAAKGLVAMLEAPAPAVVGQAFNLGSGQEVSMQQLAKEVLWSLAEQGIGAARGGELGLPITYGPARFGEEGRLFLSNAKAVKAFGYQPLVSLKTGIYETVAWFLAERRAGR